MAENEKLKHPTTLAVVVSANRAKGPEAVLQLARECVHGPNGDMGALITREDKELLPRSISNWPASSLSRRAAADRDAPDTLSAATSQIHVSQKGRR
jgi:hypothetical protein